MTSSTAAPKVHPSRVPPRQAHLDKFHNFKVCRSCNENKRLADFALTGQWRKKRAADPKRYRGDCKKCTRAPSAVQTDPGFKPHRSRKVHKSGRTSSEKRAGAADYKRRARRATRIKALEYLAEKGCCGCGERDPRVLEFDHIEPCKKKHGMSDLFSDGYSWGSEKLRSEIRKCRVICANCHRKHTIDQQDYYAHEEVQSTLREIDERYGIGE